MEPEGYDDAMKSYDEAITNFECSRILMDTLEEKEARRAERRAEASSKTGKKGHHKTSSPVGHALYQLLFENDLFRPLTNMSYSLDNAFLTHPH